MTVFSVRDVLLWWAYSTVYLELRCICFYFWSILMNWRRQWHPTPVLLPGESHGRRSLVGYSPWGRKELDTTEQLHFHFHFHSYEYILLLHYKDCKTHLDTLFLKIFYWKIKINTPGLKKNTIWKQIMLLYIFNNWEKL